MRQISSLTDIFESSVSKQRVSGAVFLSSLGGGNPDRYWPGKKIKQVDDWPTVNLLIRRKIFQQIGGFDSKYWPGEDTKLCLDIINLGKKIIYDPQVVVWHHRRAGIIKHLKQIGGYGLHRGFFARKYPETSFKIKYFIPAIFFLSIISGAMLSYPFPVIRPFFLLGLLIYALTLIFASWQIYQKEKDFLISIFSLLYIFFTHIYYGIRFIQGFILTRNIKNKLANL